MAGAGARGRRSPGPWTRYAGAIGYAPNPPPALQVSPLPDDGVLVENSAHLEWTADAGAVGIAGYAYAVDRSPDGAPEAQVNANEPAATVTVDDDGDWFFHVQALDNAGNWSAVATVPLHVDTVPLQIAGVTYRTFAYNPGFGTLPIRFTVNKPSDVTVTILPASADTPLRTYELGAQQDAVQLAWDGRDDGGQVVPSGSYRFRVQAADEHGRTADAIYKNVLLTQKRIVISLSRQALTAFDGNTVVLSTLVTTGGPSCRRRRARSRSWPGIRHSPSIRRGPRAAPSGTRTSPPVTPCSSPTAVTSSTMRRGAVGSGPGSNAVAGTPGGNGTGTHGCVNVPYGVQSRLFFWTDVGTPVIVTY